MEYQKIEELQQNILQMQTIQMTLGYQLKYGLPVPTAAYGELLKAGIEVPLQANKAVDITSLNFRYLVAINNLKEFLSEQEMNEIRNKTIGQID